MRSPKAPLKPEVRPLAPASTEALRGVLGHRDRTLVSLLSYGGLRPQEARALRWGHVQDRTLVINAHKTGRRRSVGCSGRSPRICASGGWRRDGPRTTPR